MQSRTYSKVIPPAGYDLIEKPNGVVEVVKRPAVDSLKHTVGFRVSDSQMEFLTALFDTFPQKAIGAAIRWLIEQPEVIAVATGRIQSQTRPGP